MEPVRWSDAWGLVHGQLPVLQWAVHCERKGKEWDHSEQRSQPREVKEFSLLWLFNIGMRVNY